MRDAIARALVTPRMASSRCRAECGAHSLGRWCLAQCAADVFDDGKVLFDAIVEHGLEGVVAKRRTGLYRPGYRCSTKIKNPSYWRRESEIAQMQRSREHRVRLTVA
jgi:hypothetical protein